MRWSRRRRSWENDGRGKRSLFVSSPIWRWWCCRWRRWRVWCRRRPGGRWARAWRFEWAAVLKTLISTISPLMHRTARTTWRPAHGTIYTAPGGSSRTFLTATHGCSCSSSAIRTANLYRPPWYSSCLRRPMAPMMEASSHSRQQTTPWCKENNTVQ